MADFDPDAYLSSTAMGAPGATEKAPAFDPDAYLKGSTTPELSAGETAADVAKSGGIGLVKGGIGLAGLPGDAGALMSSGADKLYDMINPPQQNIDGLVSGQPPQGGIPQGVKDAVRTVARGLPGIGALVSGPTSQQIQSKLEDVAGPLYEPKTRLGRYAETAGEFAPAVLGGPEAMGTKIATRVLAPAAVGQTAAELAKGTPLEPYAKAVGSVAGAVGASGAVNAVRGAVSPQSNVAADLARAITRDQETPESMMQALQQARQVRPEATLADVGGENVRGLVERIAQTPGAGRTTVVPTLTGRQQAQMGRLSNDLAELTGTRQTAVRATQETMAGRAEAATPLYRQAYQDGDTAIWSPELERLSSSPTIQGAMRGAVRIWRDNAIADGYGAMNPGAVVDRGGRLSFLNGQVPAFPNLQFWDYTKRIIDDQVGAAVRAGQNQKARTLTTLARSLRGELDTHVPSYAEARQAWGGPSQYMEAIQDGGNILQRTLSGEQLRANLGEMTEAQREGYLIGAVSSVVHKMRSDPAKLGDMTKYLRSPEMRDKITALMPTPEAAQNWQRRLDYEVRSSELTGRALGNSATARRLAERQDADSMVGDLVMGALAHGPTLGLLRQTLLALPNRVRDSLRSRSDHLLADVLTQPQGAGRMRQTLQDVTDQAGQSPVLPPLSAAVYGEAAGHARGGKVKPWHPAQLGAKRAKDGHWYLRDENRPGKYLKVERKAPGASRSAP